MVVIVVVEEEVVVVEEEVEGVGIGAGEKKIRLVSVCGLLYLNVNSRVSSDRHGEVLFLYLYLFVLSLINFTSI